MRYLLILLVVMASCIPYKSNLEACIGKPPSATKAQWGTPDRIIRDEDGGFVYVYDYDGVFASKKFYFGKDSICYLLRTH